MRRIFYKLDKNGERKGLRVTVLALFLLASISGGGAVGYAASGVIFSTETVEKQVKVTEIVLTKVSINVAGRGTLLFDARIGIRVNALDIPDLQVLRDATLSLTTSAGSLPIVRQSQKVIPAINSALKIMIEDHGFASLSIENAALYQTGL